MLDDNILFVNKDGKVCEIVSRGDSAFLTHRPEIGYSLEQHDPSYALAI
jgi:hypothetical protein